jgi:hypothetical protein
MTGEGRRAVRRRGTRAAIRLKVAEVVAVGHRAAETAETVGMAAETAAEKRAAAGAAHRTSTADRNHAADTYQKVTKKGRRGRLMLDSGSGVPPSGVGTPPAEPEQNAVISSRQLNRLIR